MRVTRDEWTPLFRKLAARASASGRQKLLNDCIEELKSITVDNFGATGAYRPEPWPLLNEKYANSARSKKFGDRTPTLILSGKLSDPESFVTLADSKSATLTNNTEYADYHLKSNYANKTDGKPPDRPYYPVESDGETITPFAEEQLKQIVYFHFLV